jgi:hypothetical protein
MFANEINITVALWCAFALFLGGVVKGTFGIGTPLLTVPLMSLVLPAHLTVVLMAAPVVLANAWQAFHAGNPVAAIRRFWPVCVAILGGTYVGTRLLATIDTGPLLAIIGSLIICFALIQYATPLYRSPPHLERPAGVGIGLVSGVVGGVTSMFGPPLILYLLSLHLHRDTFVQAISLLFLWAVIPWVVTLYLFGLLDTATTILSLGSAIPTFGGILAGQQLRRHVNETRFRGIVLLLVAISGSVMLVRATFS